MDIYKNLFKMDSQGKEILHFKLQNSHGIQVWITNYGATITSILTPDKNDKFEDIVLGFDNIDEYKDPKNPYFGATCGRYANRIKNGMFSLQNKTYLLAKNDGPHSLHGGEKGFDKHIWMANEENGSLYMERMSLDNEEGYPGNMNIKVYFNLNENNELKISYTANTDRPTVINLTNHSYFNLAGKGSILDHQIKINANKYTVVDNEAIPTGELRNVSETEMDLRSSTPIRKYIDKVQGLGYDHNYCLNNQTGNINIAAEVYEPTSGRTLTCLTTEPGIQFYTGNFLNGISGKKGLIYKKNYGFCLEAQHFPDSPNNSNFPSTLLMPNQTYTSTCIYKFGIINEVG